MIYLSIAIVVLIAIVTNQLAILYWGEKFEEKEK